MVLLLVLWSSSHSELMMSDVVVLHQNDDAESDAVYLLRCPATLSADDALPSYAAPLALHIQPFHIHPSIPDTPPRPPTDY